MSDEIVYEDAVGSLAGSRAQLEESRDETMNWLDEYYQTPDTASLVSENLEALLDPTSQYMIDAQTASEEARNEQGYLDSGFNKGMGTVAAIDNAFNVALDDAYVDVFNVNQTNLQYRQEYITAYDAAMKAMLTQGQQSFDEYGYSLIVDSMSETQEDLLELKDKEYEYADLLQTSNYEDNVDRLHLKHANDLANRVLRNKSGLQGYYLEAYTGIIGSDISQSDKYEQLLGLGYQIDEATTAAVDQQYMKVGDNPYGISFIDALPPYDVGDITDDAFNWRLNDAEFEYVAFKEMLDKIYIDIHAQTNHQERDASSLWYVVNDLLMTQLNALDKTSQSFIDKMEFFNRTKTDRLGNDPTNDEIQAYFYDVWKINESIGSPNKTYEGGGFSYPAYDVVSYSWNSELEIIEERVTTYPGSTPDTGPPDNSSPIGDYT